MPEYTLSQVKDHNKRSDCWIVIHGKVYDVSKFLSENGLIQHPGGEDVLVEKGGKDATTDFEDIGHSSGAVELLKKYLVGTLAKEDTPAAKSDEREKQDKVDKNRVIYQNLAIIGVAVLAWYLYRHYIQ